MKVGELFAGIGGFGLAAQRAGCGVVWACEIDDFASRVYAARFPDVPIHPDVRGFGYSLGCKVDCITAGFPCQDVSVAGKRKGLIGERTGLFWEIIRIAKGLRPRWLLLENVPGLLSSHRGRDFETVLAALDELGYGVSWRVLDAQFFGVPQRRRRVFIVGHLGSECPAEVLFEPESVSGNTPSRSKARAGVTQSLTRSLGNGGADDNDAQGGLIVTAPITASYGTKWNGNSGAFSGENFVAHCESGMGWWREGIGTMTHRDYRDGFQTGIITHALSSEGADASEDGTGRGTPIVPVMFSDPRRHDIRGVHRGDVRDMPCLNATNNDLLLAPTLRGFGHGWQGQQNDTHTVMQTRPRRLTPRECERLQGFPDDWTLINGASDSARYRALGNAVAVPVVEWILRRLGAISEDQTP